MFPEMFNDFLASPVVARGIRKNVLEVEIVDIRQFADGSYRHIDDSPYGGGAGMIMRFPPILDALDSVRTKESHVILLAPAGETYTQKKAHVYAGLQHLIIICGHYEGIDARVYDHVDELISIGDYVITGGELAAEVITDSIARLLKGTIRDASVVEESYENGLLEYPQYTRPVEYKGERVPHILLSGDHEKIRLWRLEQSLRLTLSKRPDLIEKKKLTAEECALLEKIPRDSHD